MQNAPQPHSAAPSEHRQKILGSRGFIALISFLSAFIALSTDLYLPALPTMAENLHAPVSLVNLTLTLFFIFYAISMLIWGPLSDRYGRKPILLIGLGVYILSSAGCALAPNIGILIGCRIAQAIGGAAAIAVSTAMAKDSYSGRQLESTLAIVQSMSMIAPIVAPVLGGIILGFTTWRGVFVALTVLGALAFLASLTITETIAARSDRGVFASLGRLAVVLKNKHFSRFLVTFSLMSIPFMSYVSMSSYIYIEGFGLSEQSFSYYFAANAIFLVLGPLLYMRISRLFSRPAIVTACFGSMLVGGLLLCTVGTLQPWAFILSLLPASFAGGVMRPPASKYMLDEVREDIGSASSLMGFAYMALGVVGMTLVSFNWHNRIVFIGTAYVIMALVSLAFWLFACRARVRQQEEAPASSAAS